MKDKFISWISGSFENRTDGSSARKLSAFIVMLCVVVAHGAWLKKAFMKDDFTLLIEVLTVDYFFVAVLLGLATYQQVQKMKIDNTEKEPEK